MTYNGWNNHITWLINLHFTNNEYDYERLQELAEEGRAEYAEAYPDATGFTISPLDDEEKDFVRGLVSDLAAKLKEMVESDIDDALEDSSIASGFISDVINSAMSDVDWYEWSENLLSE